MADDNGSPQRSPTDGVAGSPVASPPPAMSPEGSPQNSTLLEEVKALKAVLDANESSEQALLDALASLQAHKTIPTKILGDTLIGKSVNLLAKSASSKAVQDGAGKLVAAWRETHRKRKASFSLDRNQSLSMGSLDDSQPLASPRLSSMPSTDSLNVPDIAPSEDKNAMNPKREKIREKIAEALGKGGVLEAREGSADDGVNFKDPIVLAADIETALNLKLSEKDKLNQARAVIFNLKDKKNQMFSFKLLVGAIKPEDVPTLSAADMASEAKNAERKKMKDDAMAAIDQDWAMKNGQIRISGLFTCGKCKGTQTTYFQMQTRSSDEPMTTFASCLQCGNRWKFC